MAVAEAFDQRLASVAWKGAIAHAGIGYTPIPLGQGGTYTAWQKPQHGGRSPIVHVAAYLFMGQAMVKWFKEFMMHYVLYGALLLLLCLGIFPFVVLYAGSMSIARILDRFSPDKKRAQRLDRLWTVVGTPYDYLVKTVG